MSCKGVTAAWIWHYLTDTSTWVSYYDNVSGISFPQGGGPELKDGTVFSFGTFGFPPLDARVVEFQAPAENVPGRLAWTANQDGKPEEQTARRAARLARRGPARRPGARPDPGDADPQPAADLAAQSPNPMLNGHQAWLDGLVRAASGRLAVRSLEHDAQVDKERRGSEDQRHAKGSRVSAAR